MAVLSQPPLVSVGSPLAPFCSPWAVGPASAFCARSGKTSPKRLGRNRSRRLQVSSHSRLSPAPSSGGSRNPPFTITRRMFFKLSGTASSYTNRQKARSWDYEREDERTRTSPPAYQVVSLSAIHQPVHNVKDPEPQVKHAIPFREQDQVVEKDLTEECRGLDPSLAHADWVGLVHFGLE